MKKLTLALVIAVAATSTAGQMKNGSNPLTLSGKLLPVAPNVLPLPFPACPPCSAKR